MALPPQPDADSDQQQQEPQRSSVPIIFAAQNDGFGDVREAFSALGPTHGTLSMGANSQLMYAASGNVKPANITENIKIGIDYLTKQGWTKRQAAAILSNGIAESGLNPNSIGDGGSARRTFQWHSGRLDPLMDAYKNDSRMGASVADSPFMQDLKMMNFELTYGAERVHGAHLREIADAGPAGAYFSAAIERPAAVYAAMNERSAKAEGIMRGLEREEAKVDLKGISQLRTYNARLAVASFDNPISSTPAPTAVTKPKQDEWTESGLKKTGGVAAAATMKPANNFPAPSPLPFT